MIIMIVYRYHNIDLLNHVSKIKLIINIFLYVFVVWLVDQVTDEVTDHLLNARENVIQVLSVSYTINV